MTRLPLRGSILAVAAAAAPGAALSAFAANGTQHTGTIDYLVPVTIWSLVAICAGSIVFAILYLFKKQMGGFPQPPSWNPPIDLMLSKNLLQDPPEDGHGSDDAHHAAPAH